MQYSVKILSEARFKFNDHPNEIVEEQLEESKSQSSSEASSLITEEDSSGNQLAPEIIKIRNKNKQLQKDLTSRLMNFKSTSRSFISSSISQEDYDLSQDDHKSYPISKQDTITELSNNQKLKNMLSHLVKLQSDCDNAKNELKKNEEEIFIAEYENLTLKIDLQQTKEKIQIFSETQVEKSRCGCILI